jgi:ATP-dependent Clp protease ATP-binding subunit ClpX
MYEIPSDPSIAKVTITDKSVRGEEKPVLERDEKRLKKPPARLGAKTVQEIQRRRKRGTAS